MTEGEGGGASSSNHSRGPKHVLFVLLGFWLLPLVVPAALLGLLLLRHRGELGLDQLVVSFGLAELLGLLVELVQVEFADDVLLAARGGTTQAQACAHTHKKKNTHIHTSVKIASFFCNMT